MIKKEPVFFQPNEHEWTLELWEYIKVGQENIIFKRLAWSKFLSII